MQWVRAPKSFAETEAEVIGFITARFSDHLPNLPLSQDRISNIFSRNFLESMYYISGMIAEGYFPSQLLIAEIFENADVNPYTFALLTSMIGKFLEGSSKASYQDLEILGLPYDFDLSYKTSEEYRHFEFLYRIFSRVSAYYSPEI